MYLVCTRKFPLVLGGSSDISIHGNTDASLGTGPKGRSITGTSVQLNPDAGAVSCKASATKIVHTSIFESELDGGVTVVKRAFRVQNVIDELRIPFEKLLQFYGDNQAMVDFVKGDNIAKGVRHMALRMWYLREQYRYGSMEWHHVSGDSIPVDHLTKPASVERHQQFRRQILGLGLLSPYDMLLLELVLTVKKFV